jgi:antitoxin CptB
MIETNKLRWKCRRGMRELDVVLLHYLERHYPDANAKNRATFERMLDMQDPELYFLILGKTTTDDKDVSDVVATLRNTPRH